MTPIHHDDVSIACDGVVHFHGANDSNERDGALPSAHDPMPES